MRYLVTKQYVRGPETHCEKFNDLERARALIKEKLKEDLVLNVKVIYRIHDIMDMIEEFDPSKIDLALLKNNNDRAVPQGGHQSTSNFRPKPLNTTLKPSGIPQTWNNDHED